MTRPRWQGWTSNPLLRYILDFPSYCLSTTIPHKNQEGEEDKLSADLERFYCTRYFPLSVLRAKPFPNIMHVLCSSRWLITYSPVFPSPCVLYYKRHIYCFVSTKEGKKKREKKRKSVSRSIPTGEAKERNEFRNGTKQAACSQVQLGKGRGWGRGKEARFTRLMFFLLWELTNTLRLERDLGFDLSVGGPGFEFIQLRARAIFHHSFYNYNTCSSRVTPGAVPNFKTSV